MVLVPKGTEYDSTLCFITVQRIAAKLLIVCPTQGFQRRILCLSALRRSVASLTTVPCDLLIGDERRFGGGAEHVACTVEMTPLDYQMDVAVIDEVQMIGTEIEVGLGAGVTGLPAQKSTCAGSSLHL